eukprot:1140240-Pelagomonas_calceolata.AAC.7
MQPCILYRYTREQQCLKAPLHHEQKTKQALMDARLCEHHILIGLLPGQLLPHGDGIHLTHVRASKHQGMLTCADIMSS